MKFPIQKSCLIIILFSVCFYSCEKKSQDTRFDGSVHINLLTEGLAYVQLGLGKYFIYKDSASSELDSVVVTKSSLEDVFTPAVVSGGLTYSAYNSQIFSLTLTKFDAGIQTLWEINFKGQPALCCPSISMDNQPVEIRDTSDVSTFYYPVCNCSSSMVIPGLTVEGKLYNNVIQNIGDNGADPSSPDYRRAVTYWAKGVGIIKRIKTAGADTKTYFLIRNG